MYRKPLRMSNFVVSRRLIQTAQRGSGTEPSYRLTEMVLSRRVLFGPALLLYRSRG